MGRRKRVSHRTTTRTRAPRRRGRVGRTGGNFWNDFKKGFTSVFKFLI